MTLAIQPAQPVATVDKAAKDRRAIFVTGTNTAQSSDEIDLLQQQRLNRFGQLRCIYIDTSQQGDNGNGAIIITDYGQTFTVPPFTQGYYNVFIPFVTKLTVSSNDKVSLVLFDFDLPSGSWQTKASTSSIPNPLPVTDYPLVINGESQVDAGFNTIFAQDSGITKIVTLTITLSKFVLAAAPQVTLNDDTGIIWMCVLYNKGTTATNDVIVFHARFGCTLGQGVLGLWAQCQPAPTSGQLFMNISGAK